MVTIASNILSAARAAQTKYGIPASVQLAQYALESGWGKYDMGCFNYFGMKAVAGQTCVVKNTREETASGQSYYIHAAFRKFDTPAEAFDAHATLLTHPQYAAARAHLPNVDAFCDALTHVYATDGDYGSKLKAVIHGDHLTQYDLAL